MIVELKLKDKNVIKWKYIDNPFTRKHMKVMQDAANSGTGWNDLWYELPQWMQPNYDKDLIQEQLDIIIDAINSINRVPDAKRGERIKFPIEVKDIKWLPRKHLENQKLLNKLHRYFTTFGHSQGKFDYNGLSWCSWHMVREDIYFYIETTTSNSSLGRAYATPPKDGIHKDIMYIDPSPEFKWMELLNDKTQNINDAVHTLERWCANPQKKKMQRESKYREYALEFMPKVPYPFSAQDRKFLSYTANCDVWLGMNQILGKSYPVAYADHDDPSNWDIWEGTQWSASFSIGDRNFAGWIPFVNWMKKHGIDAVPYGMPLGKIIEGKKYVKTMGHGNEVKTILLYEE